MALVGPELGASSPSGSQPEKTVLLLDAGYDRLREPVSRAFAEFPLALRGARVLVKPNMLGPYPPERAVTTHPALVRAVVEHLLDGGARPVVGDNPGARGYGINRACGEITGIREAARGCFVNLGEETVAVTLESDIAREARISRMVREADLVVNLPKLKTHVQTIMTAGVKNTFGYLAGAEKCRMHSLARTSAKFGSLLAAVHALRPPDLTIIDAVTAMEGDGPSGGSPRHAGRLIASADAAAADCVAARLIGLEPDEVVHLAEALRRWPRGARVRVSGSEPEPLEGFRLPASFARDFKSWAANRVLFTFLKRSRLRVKEEACSGCGTCAAGCPVGAMSMASGKPRIDRKACIACYCCHELCPRGAIELNPALRALLKP